MSILEILGDPIYDEISIDQYSPSIYDVQFDDDYVDNNSINNASNDNDNVINNILIDKLQVECKENMKMFNFFVVNFNYINPFYYKFNIITKINLFSGYMDTLHLGEGSLRFAIHYSRS